MSKVRTEVKTHDCNDCGRAKCGGDVLRGKRGMFKRFISCPGQIKLEPMKVTLLENASKYDGFATELNRITRDMGLIFQERKFYPYFRFLQT